MTISYIVSSVVLVMGAMCVGVMLFGFTLQYRKDNITPGLNLISHRNYKRKNWTKEQRGVFTKGVNKTVNDADALSDNQQKEGTEK